MEVGYENVKKGRDGIRKHGESLIHRNSESGLNSALNLAAHRVMVNDNVKKEISVNRTALQAVFENLRFCDQKGIHSAVTATKNSCKFPLSDEPNRKIQSQNKAPSLLRDLKDRVRRESNGLSKEPLFSIIIDETTDINRSEQVFCLSFCKSKMKSEEVFLGFHKTSRTDAETLFNLVKSSLMSFELSLLGVRGQGYNGVANIAGRHNGLQTKVLAENSKAIYLYIALDTN
ncbi:Zinc finger MYM-type protein 1-like [Oopsacas minuta]|uniref:Zinc finger MYM-type protein 1-like n=1 Tax=Oopsacas minuta TaxID=111878 RepID=A0AAV7KCP6_9METZ|nr:Zinc finger MYM-type protein 1-like [Oopsacas minuta]